MEFLNETLTHLLGDSKSFAWYAAAIIWALIGQLLSLRTSIKKDEAVTNPETPTNFSFWWALKDNAVRLVTGVLTAFTAIRFSTELLGSDPTLYLAFLYGFASDFAVKALGKFQETARK